MKLRLVECDAALSYSQDIRCQAASLASNYAWFSPLTYLWFVVGMLFVVLIHPAASVFVPHGVLPGLDFFLIFLQIVLIPSFVGRRMLVTRREEIIRLINGGYNGPDKSHPNGSA